MVASNVLPVRSVPSHRFFKQKSDKMENAKCSLLFGLVCTTCFLMADAQEVLSNKKLIHLGFELTSPQVVKANYKKMELMAPFDGITFILRDTTSDGSLITEGSIFKKKLINRSDLASSVQDIKACHFQKFKNNFIRINTVPGNLAWNDDAAWNAAAGNMGTIAWFAKQAGLAGICYDPESYGEKQFEWRAASRLSFETAKALARARGKQLMQSVGKEYEDIVFWGLFLFSFNRPAINSVDINAAIQTEGYGLYPSFVEGLLDGLPLKAKMVDGNEDAYYARNRESLLSIYNQSRSGFKHFLLPENKAKYNTQVSVGLALYTDMYTNDAGNRFYFGPSAERTRLERFRDRIQEALEITDEYVWLYNEDYKWWDIPFAEERFDKHRPITRIENKLPGITESVVFAKQPYNWINNKLDSQSFYESNEVKNPSFDVVVPTAQEVLNWSATNVPKGYLIWRPDSSKAMITTLQTGGLKNTACAKITNGSALLIQQVKIKPNEKYVIYAHGKKSGGSMVASVKWMNELSQFTDWNCVAAFSFSTNDCYKWNRAVGVVRVPEGVYSMQLFIECYAVKATDEFYLDDIGVVEQSQFFKN